jgi:RNA-directed DNA polymerase
VSISGSQGKPFQIDKRLIWEAWKQVKRNQGAPGIDGQTVKQFEEDLEGGLFKLWNRMSSGSYFPSPVRVVEIPKKGSESGRTRTLGVPTVYDRVAQAAVAMFLDSIVDPVFHDDSYGYRNGRSPLDAVGRCRERCWRSDWGAPG